MKKRLLTILLVLVLILSTFAVVACGDDSTTTSQIADNMTIVIQNEKTITSYVVALEDQAFTAESKVIDVLFYLRDNEGLYLDGSSSAYGYWLMGIGGLRPTGTDWICVYTSVFDEQDLSADPLNEIDYNGTKVVAANLGVSSLTFGKDVVILFAVVQ